MVDSTRTGRKSIYHSKCEILIKLDGSKRCATCKTYRKTLSTMVSRQLRHQKDDGTNPSSHTTYANLHSAEKDERLRRLHQETKKVKLCIARLKKRISAATVRDGVELDDELSNELKSIMAAKTQQVYSTYPEGSFQRLFLGPTANSFVL